MENIQIKKAFSQADFPQEPLPEMAFVGRSNVGKSSLINFVFHEKNLCPVSKTPGKTRSVNFYTINHKFRIVDLPGYGYAKISKSIHQTWPDMIKEYFEHQLNITAIFFLVDSRRDITREDLVLFEWLCQYTDSIYIVITKTDKINQKEKSQLTRRINKFTENTVASKNIIYVSIKSQESRKLLLDAMNQHL